jgi:hypothetical protein
MGDVGCWAVLVVQALVVGWLVALVDAWWKLQRIVLELHSAWSAREEKPANSGQNVTED